MAQLTYSTRWLQARGRRTVSSIHLWRRRPTPAAAINAYAARGRAHWVDRAVSTIADRSAGRAHEFGAIVARGAEPTDQT